MHRKHAVRASIVFVALLGAILLVAVAVGYTSPSKSVTLDDPDNQTINTTVNFINNDSDPGYSPSLSFRLQNESGVVATETISANSETTKTLSLSTAGLDSGVYGAVINSSSLNRAQVNSSPSIRTTKEAYIANETTDSLGVNLAFNGSREATSFVTVETDAGVEIINRSVSYLPSQHSSNEWTKSMLFNESDGIETGNLTVTATVDNASLYRGLSVSDSSDGGGLLTGTIGGQDTSIALAGLAVIAGIILYFRRED